MSKGITEKEPDPRVVYADIIDLPHWQSPTRLHMSLYDRSAQFASYKALSGYEDMIQEEARLTDSEEQLSEEAMVLLNQKLSLISNVISEGMHPELTFTVVWWYLIKRNPTVNIRAATDAPWEEIDTVFRKGCLTNRVARKW